LSSRDIRDPQLVGKDLRDLADQVRLDSPDAKLSDVYDWARDNGIAIGHTRQQTVASNGSAQKR
jgi:hypothetical protein